MRNYGCFLDISRYFLPAPVNIPPERHPFENKVVVAYSTKAELFDTTDVYYRGFDQAFPDYWREAEWEREFDEFVKNNNLPSLSLVRLGSDHTGSFGTAIDEVNTPERQQADNDYAVGKLVEKIANSRYKTDTLIFILEDDAQSGEDHVDAHRSTAYVVGPYVKQGKVVSEFYTTVSMLRSFEAYLPLELLWILLTFFSYLLSINQAEREEIIRNTSFSQIKLRSGMETGSPVVKIVAIIQADDTLRTSL